SMNQSGANYDISIWLSYDITTWFLQRSRRSSALCQIMEPRDFAAIPTSHPAPVGSIFPGVHGS
ncbi:hypothetical protein, partial [Burkholderia ubonensis]|uniref:hypothetical protein n=1 Tax=Burkholderia ubonensis TaxID=101571 RepID=UPI001E374503